MAEYTPTDEDMRTAWLQSHQVPTWGGQSDIGGRPKERIAEWYRWLAAHDAEVRAQALAERGEREYMVSDGDGNVWALTSSLDDARHYASQEPGAMIETRTSTPWEVVPETEGEKK